MLIFLSIQLSGAVELIKCSRGVFYTLTPGSLDRNTSQSLLKKKNDCADASLKTISRHCLDWLYLLFFILTMFSIFHLKVATSWFFQLMITIWSNIDLLWLDVKQRRPLGVISKRPMTAVRWLIQRH